MAFEISAAKDAKNDEFYTQLVDIQSELNNYSDKKRFVITNIEGTAIGFYNCDTYWNFNNLNEMKTWLDNNKNMYANYVLQNPIEQTLELPKLSINKNTSVISVNTSITPSNIELEYYR